MTPAFNVNLFIAVFSGEPDHEPLDLIDDPRMIVFTRTLSLPFAPFPGLNLAGMGSIKEVTWSADEAYFYCILHERIASEDPVSGLRFNELCSDLEESGWQRMKKHNKSHFMQEGDE